VVQRPEFHKIYQFMENILPSEKLPVVFRSEVVYKEWPDIRYYWIFLAGEFQSE